MERTKFKEVQTAYDALVSKGCPHQAELLRQSYQKVQKGAHKHALNISVPTARH